jgi:outer membrane protein TolC
MTYNFTYIFFSVLLIAVPASVHSQNVDVDLSQGSTLSIEQAIEIAIANNNDIKRAWFSVEDADEQVRIAWSEVLPEVTTSATYTRNVQLPVTFFPAEFFGGQQGDLVPVTFGTDNDWTGGVSVSQNLFRGEAIIGISSSTLFKAAQQENLRATTQQVVTETRKAYHRVLIAEEQQRLQLASINRLEENLEDNRGRLRAGLVEEYDVLRLEVQLANQRPELRETELAIDQAYRNLKIVTGIPLELNITISGELGSFDIHSEQATDSSNESLKKIDRMNQLSLTKERDIIDLMSELRGDLRILQKQDELKDREITAIKSRFLPTISTTYNLRWTAAQEDPIEPFKDAVRFQTIGLNVSLPIFQGFKRSAEVNRAKIEKKDINQQQMFTKRVALNEYETSVENLNRLFDTADARKQAISQANRGYEIALKRFENGMGSQLEVTEAELQVREAELNYARLVFDYLNAKADYDQVIGLVPMVSTNN